MACVDLPALPLQLLLRRHPEWRQQPAAVVEADSPLSPLLWVNEAARRGGVLPGVSYAAGLSLDRNLCAGTVAMSEIATAVDKVQRRLLNFSPEVEPSRREPGVFWVNAGGLDRLHGSPGVWARRIRADLGRRDLVAHVAVGCGRFGSYCLARTRRGIAVADSHQAEAAVIQAMSLARLSIEPRVRDELARLGVHTVGEFLALPAASIHRRFGDEAWALYQLARGDRCEPWRPYRPVAPDRTSCRLEHLETDAHRLLFLIKRLLHPLLDRLAGRQQAVAGLDLKLCFTGGRQRCEELRPAAPTLDVGLLMDLVRLRLENLPITAGVERVILQVTAADALPEILRLFREHPRRDRQAGLRAVARVRAEFGDDAVVRAELRPGHLPEAGFRWLPVAEFTFPTPQRTKRRPLIRRILDRPRPLAESAVGPSHRHGPYFLSGGWWRREVRRAYHFVETDEGELLWVYYDQRRRRWYLQGKVE